MEDNFAFVCQSASIKSWIFFFYHPHFNIFIYFISFIPRLVFKSAAFDCLNCVAVPMGLLGELLQLLLHILIKMNWKSSRLFSGVVPKSASQVASAGEAGGEFHQAPGHLLLLALLRTLFRWFPGHKSAAGPLAFHSNHHFLLSAVPPRFHHCLPGAPRHIHSFSATFHAVFLEFLLLKLSSLGTQSSSAPHGHHVPPARSVPVFSGSKKLQYCLTEDEGQGTYSVYWEDVVMLRS